MTRKIINFYEFADLEPLDLLGPRREACHAEAERLGLRGTILIAPEGINVGLEGTEEVLQAYVDWIRQDPKLANVVPKWSTGQREPFEGLRSKIKRWIIRFADDEPLDVDSIRGGARMAPEEFREILRQRPADVVIVDSRNLYETEYGHFEGCETLAIDKFTQFREAFLERYADRKDKTYVMYCTGGVRCEKTVAWARKHGFENAVQLDGGILGYFDRCGGEGWKGNCFVFDRRYIVDPKGDEAEDPPEFFGPRMQPKPRLGA